MQGPRRGEVVGEGCSLSIDARRLGGADDDVVLARVSMQQHLRRGDEHHVHVGIVQSGEAPHVRRELGGERRLEARPDRRGRCTGREVRRQLERRERDRWHGGGPRGRVTLNCSCTHRGSMLGVRCRRGPVAGPLVKTTGRTFRL